MSDTMTTVDLDSDEHVEVDVRYRIPSQMIEWVSQTCDVSLDEAQQWLVHEAPRLAAGGSLMVRGKMIDVESGDVGETYFDHIYCEQIEGDMTYSLPEVDEPIVLRVERVDS